MSSTFASRLLLTRRDLKWNQEHVAAKSGVSRAYISNLERANVTNPTIDVVEAIAAALSVRPEYLAGWSDDATGEDRPANAAEGRVVYQVARPGEYRLIQDLLTIWPDLTPDDQRLLIDMARRLRTSDHARIIE